MFPLNPQRIGEGLERGDNGGVKRGSLGQRTRIGLVIVEVMAIGPQLVEHLGGCGSLAGLGGGWSCPRAPQRFRRLSEVLETRLVGRRHSRI
jgi:hypothetical protein